MGNAGCNGRGQVCGWHGACTTAVGMVCKPQRRCVATCPYEEMAGIQPASLFILSINDNDEKYYIPGYFPEN